jgi:hypothetical protein
LGEAYKSFSSSLCSFLQSPVTSSLPNNYGSIYSVTSANEWPC